MNEITTRASIGNTGMRCALPFTKMQALGNDFVFVDESELAQSELGASLLAGIPESFAGLARQVCDRHFGIGADGLIIVRPAQRSDCQISWLYLNSDGTVSAMCGNGLRCLALWAVSEKRVPSGNFAVETAVGPVHILFENADSIVTNIGVPVLAAAQVPLRLAADERFIARQLEVDGLQFTATCLSLGNPHCVIFDDGLTDEQRRIVAPEIQRNQLFPESVNVEFVNVSAANAADVFVWERGCGPTLACASGAAAVLVAGVIEKRLERTASIRLPGGVLQISWLNNEDSVSISGSARISYRGVFDLAQFVPTDSLLEVDCQ